MVGESCHTIFYECRRFCIHIVNDSISESGFDLAAVFSHPCYTPIGVHLQESCERRFGVYGNLQASLRSTKFREALVVTFGPSILSLLGSAKTDFAESEAEDAAQAQEDADVVSFYGDFRARQSQLWDICKERFESNPAACYQDNLRLLEENEIAVSGNVNHR